MRKVRYYFRITPNKVVRKVGICLLNMKLIVSICMYNYINNIGWDQQIASWYVLYVLPQYVIYFKILLWTFSSDPSFSKWLQTLFWQSNPKPFPKYLVLVNMAATYMYFSKMFAIWGNVLSKIGLYRTAVLTCIA